MSEIYDNWEKLVRAVRLKVHLRQLASCPSLDSTSSFNDHSVGTRTRTYSIKSTSSSSSNGSLGREWTKEEAQVSKVQKILEEEPLLALVRDHDNRLNIVYEGWMGRYGRRKIGISFVHLRYFVLESRFLAYYKNKPQDNAVPIMTLPLDGNCRLEDQGLKVLRGHMFYALSVYNEKKAPHQMMLAGFSIPEALIWKEKIQSVIDQFHLESQPTIGDNSYCSSECESGMEAESSNLENLLSTAEDEDKNHRSVICRTTLGNGNPEFDFRWTNEMDPNLDLLDPNNNHAFSQENWRLLQCQNGLRIFEELLEVDFLPKSYIRAMKAVGVVEATCEEIFELVMSMDATRWEWDCSFTYGSLVEEVDGHTAIVYHRLQLDWFPWFVWPRDLCYVRYWRRNDDGSFVVLFHSREHDNCPPQKGYVRAHIESGGYNLSPLKPRGGRARTKVQLLMQVDLKGWGMGYISAFQHHSLLQMLNGVAGLREYFNHTDRRPPPPPLMDEYSDEEEDFYHSDLEI